MIVILPPSETKRDGGAHDSSLDLTALGFPALLAHRRTAVAALKVLSRSVGDSTIALGLGPTQRAEIDRNRAVTSSPVMPVMDRFTGVLYEALDASALDGSARDWLAGNVLVHSALFGMIGAADAIPAYRLSHDSRLPGLVLKKHWRDAIAAQLATAGGVIVDLRSEGYVALGPAPARAGSVYVRVVTPGVDGVKRALNHFNKKGKGEFVRALALAGNDHATLESLLDWAESVGIRLERTAALTSDGREIIDLVV